MLNKTGITKTVGAAPSQILYNVQNQVSVPIKVVKTYAGAVTENGRKIVKAGTPLNGDLLNRGTSFVAPDANKPAVGILLHDVDITDADANGTLLIFGFVNVNRIDSTTAALITATVQTQLSGKVYFLKDN